MKSKSDIVLLKEFGQYLDDETLANPEGNRGGYADSTAEAGHVTRWYAEAFIAKMVKDGWNHPDDFEIVDEW